MGKKLLLDTDIGSDIDDVLALIYILNKMDAELLGITTVSGQAGQRANLAQKICFDENKKDIPIFKGFSNPIIGKQIQKTAPQSEVLDKEFNINNDPIEAVKFMSDTIKANPDKITLIGIGPLTNIAYLFKLFPETKKLIKDIVLMNGVFFSCPYETHKAEWNTLLDPIAAEIVYENIKDIDNLMVGLDVTTQCKINSKESINKFSNYKGNTETIIAPLQVWNKDFDEVVFHDPLAVASIFKPELLETQKGVVELELQSRRLSGLTYWEKRHNGPHKIAFKVNSEAFFEEYFSVLGI